MSHVTYKCHSCGTSHDVEQIRRSLYIAQRSLGDLEALNRSAPGGGRLVRRLVRRRITRTLMRELWK